MSGPSDFIMTRELWEQFDDWREPLTERDAYVWLGLYGPARMNAKYLAQQWRWKRERVMPFLRKMIACGLFSLDERKISAVHLRVAKPNPEYVVGQSWRSLRLRVFARDGFACTYCGSAAKLHCDHIMPRVRGGLDIESNLTTACQDCNLSKGSKLIGEWQ